MTPQVIAVLGHPLTIPLTPNVVAIKIAKRTSFLSIGGPFGAVRKFAMSERCPMLDLRKSIGPGFPDWRPNLGRSQERASSSRPL